MPKGVYIQHENEESKKQYKRDYNNNRYCPIKNKNNKLKKAYGITIDEYNKLFNLQDGCCAICNRHQTELTRNLAVDHNHITGEIRGLLCSNCNTGIGNLRDDVNLLERAIEYLTTKK